MWIRKLPTTVDSQLMPRMQIELQPEPYHTLSYLNAGTKREGCRYDDLPFLRGRITGLPPGPPALVATGDLQGRSDFGDDEETLLGVAVADDLPEIHESAGIPDPSDCCGFLIGDLYTVPNATKRGGTGNVRLVWQVMSETFGSLAGVAGNHDTFSNPAERGSARPPRHCLDGSFIDVANWRVGGVSGSIGRPETSISLKKKAAVDFVRMLGPVLEQKPDILVLHASPFVDERHVGSQLISDCLIDADYSGLVLCGHCPWPQRIQMIGKATVLNVHEAVVTLTVE